MALNAETLVITVFIILAISALNNGGWSTDNWLVWGPALVLKVPFEIAESIAANAPILVPLAIIGILAYFNFIGAMLGEAFLALVVFGAIIVFMGV